MAKKIAFFLFCSFIIFSAKGQLQQSNIYLFDMKQSSDSTFEFTRPQYLTQFNHNGYNNQPAFFSNTELFITVQFPFENQTDLYVLNLKDTTKTRVTETVEGEYSPKRMPDYFNFSAVRQEINGRDTILRLWQFPVDRLGSGRPIFKYLTGIGYYHWLNSYQVAVFIVDDPSYLGIVDTRSDKLEAIATNPGRCFKKLPNGNLAYVQKSDFSLWKIMEKNMYSRDVPPVKVIDALPGAEDFAVLPDGTLLMGQGSKLFKFNKYIDSDWVEIADFRFYEIKNITRLAVGPNYQIAIVAD